jgi:benzoyl-CoA 2,3-dioxygenase component B
MFTDRDGKYQLLALAESSFDPLSRTTRFMLTEEAHHMFVGETGIGRIVKRACDLMKQDPNEDARNGGGLDLDTIQKYVNFWYSSSLDLFGGEISTNAADYFASGLKGREHEDKWGDHIALNGSYRIPIIEDGRMSERDVPLRNAMNEVLRDSYIDDNQRGVDRWNRMIAEAGVNYTITLPSRRFNRTMGIYSGHAFEPKGNPISREEFERRKQEWLPSASDREYVNTLMQPVLERGKMANWIAAPERGIKGQPLDFEYIRRV